jgi:hypothetical protein
MDKPNSYMDYTNFSISEKFDFFEIEISNVVQTMEERRLNKFLKSIILDNSENSHIRKSAQKVFIECVFLKKLKPRQALNLLIDDWIETSELFLEIQRIKNLYFLYDKEPSEIEDIFINYSKNEEHELASEAYLNLGLINMQKGLMSKEQSEIYGYLNISEDHLYQANKLIENRVDAQYYQIVVSVIKDLVSRNTGNLKRSLNNLASILYRKKIYSFDYKENIFELGFYRVLFSISKMIEDNPKKWLDYPKEFSKLHTQYSEIKNQQIKNRLNKSVVSVAFSNIIGKEFLEPYFSLNFASEISKIETYLQDQEEGSELYNFLVHVKTLAEDNHLKKKIKTTSIKQQLRNNFPSRSETAIDNALKKCKYNTSIDLLNVFEELRSPSIQKFIDELIVACVKLQGNRIYRGNFSEDDRNTYISDLLDGDNYRTKDQTRWSKSAAGKSAGEIDILVKDNKSLPFTIIEALNLKSVLKGYIITHINKTFKYDTTGFEYNFIVAYVNIKNFGSFWKNYIKFISNHVYQYKFLSIQEITDYNYADIRIAKAKHIRNEKEIYLYHVAVNLSE